jgi:K+-transporting ATPase ATPase A chain
MARVYRGERVLLTPLLGWLERLMYRGLRTDPTREQDWKAYARSVIVFSVVFWLALYVILRTQGIHPFNPEGFHSAPWDVTFNTASSFVTNTNWQYYGGETTMTYFSQMAGLAVQNFVSAAVGMAVLVAVIRGFASRGARELGNFWQDLTRSLVYILLPLSFVGALVLVSQGVIQNLSGYATVHTLGGAEQTLAMGPVASQEAIKMLGTNGGGFFNANSAHPFENPTPLTNFVQMLSIFAIGGGLTYTYGRMARDQRQGWAILAAMMLMFGAGVATAYWAETHPNPALAGLGVDQAAGNLEGKEVRFGQSASTLFATVTTDASCGAVNAMHDSFTALGGLVPLANIQLGELVFGGVGAGLYAILVYVVLSVFIAGLMVGRTPEYLGKKIEAREMRLAMLYILIFPLITLGYAAWSAVAPYGVSSLNNAGPHGLSEILYAYSSGAGNNGSGFAGLNANTPWWNVTLGITMLAGRFLMIIPILAIGGSMVGKRVVPAGLGTFPTDGALFTGLLVGVVVIVGALTFFPALCLGPIVEHFLGSAGKVY